jgi:hypothetical protein
LCAHLDPLDLVIGDIEEIGCKPPPAYIDDRGLGSYPDIRIPVKELVEEYGIDEDQIWSKYESRYAFLHSKYIMIIEKTRYDHSKKCPEKYLFEDDKKVSMKDFCDRVFSADVFREKKSIKSIHIADADYLTMGFSL